MDILWTIVVGGIVGWLASIVMRTNAQMGIVLNVVVGIVGAVLGGWLAPKLGIVADGTIERLLVALGGAVLVILVLRVLRILR
jgi:uncharacterized membrane protein YeaQ/YmgE (transglycosylase-associated protein family)